MSDEKTRMKLALGMREKRGPMVITTKYTCDACGLKWTRNWQADFKTITRMDGTCKSFTISADVSPCCGNATINMRTGEQIFLTREEAAALKQGPNS